MKTNEEILQQYEIRLSEGVITQEKYEHIFVWYEIDKQFEKL